ncbi:Uncharacterised protein [Bordetella pertussis]|nr:Uncharacterised protein [Bordetella pertussis]
MAIPISPRLRARRAACRSNSSSMPSMTAMTS